ncbi:hypothetical protein [Colwellia echini]|uniref:Uncharacterized protein n=1 Tax=Colwellia echini TaxID=1982103 RepID=A0ABY3MW39_9GAMM|nr:hypothetical protein [Colwellia echini]TYK65423.1 hypothetical protein CWS31_010020 [Colwellia echini]
MLTSQGFKSRTGQHYTLRLSCKSNQFTASKAEAFTNHNSALQFIHNLQLPLFFLESLAQSNSFYSYSNWRNANPWAKIEDYIAQTLLQGSIKAYSCASPNALNESRQIRSFKDAQGKSFELQPASALLIDIAAEVKPVTDTKSAEKILQELAITAESAEVLTKSLNIPANSSNSIDALKNALINGDIVVKEQAQALKPSGDGQFIEEVVTQATSPANSAPPAKEESAEKKEKEEECDFYNLRLHCQHKVNGERKFELDVINKQPNHNGSQYGLQVIAPPKTPDYISVLFNGVCRQGSDTCGGIKVSGPNTSKVITDKTSYCFSVAPKKLGTNESSNSFINFLKTNLIPSLDGLQYETYTVESQSCNSAHSHKAIIQAFPSFKWAGEIAIGYKQDADKTSENTWYTKGKIGGNIGERTLSYDTETKNKAEDYFPGLQGVLGNTLSQLSKFSEAKGNFGSLVKFDINSAISLGGSLDLEESTKNYDVGFGGEVAVNLNPLFGATVSVDIFDWLALSTGGPIFLKYKEMAAKGEDHAVVLKAVISVKGDIIANLKWKKGVDDKWLSTEGTVSSQAALGVTIGLEAEISAKSKIFLTEITVSVGAKAALQGARSNAEGIGIISTLTATTAEDKPAVSGSIAFTGATLYYSYYAEVGVSEAKSETVQSTSDDETVERSRGGDDDAGTPASSSESKVRAGKESKIPIFKYREWPKISTVSEAVMIDQIKF